MSFTDEEKRVNELFTNAAEKNVTIEKKWVFLEEMIGILLHVDVFWTC